MGKKNLKWSEPKLYSNQFHHKISYFIIILLDITSFRHSWTMALKDRITPMMVILFSTFSPPRGECKGHQGFTAVLLQHFMHTQAQVERADTPWFTLLWAILSLIMAQVNMLLYTITGELVKLGQECHSGKGGHLTRLYTIRVFISCSVYF